MNLNFYRQCFIYIAVFLIRESILQAFTAVLYPGPHPKTSTWAAPASCFRKGSLCHPVKEFLPFRAGSSHGSGIGQALAVSAPWGPGWNPRGWLTASSAPSPEAPCCVCLRRPAPGAPRGHREGVLGGTGQALSPWGLCKRFSLLCFRVQAFKIPCNKLYLTLSPNVVQQ